MGSVGVGELVALVTAAFTLANTLILLAERQRASRIEQSVNGARDAAVTAAVALAAREHDATHHALEST